MINTTPLRFRLIFLSFYLQKIESFESSILGTHYTIEDLLWYPNSGASHHIINDPTIFLSKHMYHGTNNVKISNGSGMDIQHVGSTNIVLPHTNSIFILKDLMHVLEITKKFD